VSIRKKWLEVAADGKGDKSEPKEACEIKMKWEILRKNSQGRQFFAERLNDLLSEKGINCGRLAGVLGADPSMFSRYKEGVCFPSFKTMCDIMDYFKCSIDSFFPVDQKLLESQNKERPRNSRQRCHDYIKGAVDEKNILSDSKMKSASRFLLNSQDDTENTVSEVESLSRVDKQVSVWGKAKELIALIQEICPDSKEKTISISKMEEAIMWASNAISRQE
jgi:transcriptional regulator with XRE-family HTH domain